MKKLCRSIAALAAVAAFGAEAPPSSTSTKDDAPNSVFQKPVRLMAAGAVIDSGPQWAHSGPVPPRCGWRRPARSARGRF